MIKIVHRFFFVHKRGAYLMEVNSKQFPEDPVELVLLNDGDPADLHIFKTYYRPLFNSTLKKRKLEFYNSLKKF